MTDGRLCLAQPDSSSGAEKSIAVRFRGQVQPISTWKEGTIKLVEMFEAAQPGMLASLVATGDFTADLSADPHRFHRSKANVGGVYFNTHASMQELKRRLRKIAEGAGIGETDYAFVPASENPPPTI